MLDLSYLPPAAVAGLLGVLGLLVGSFLNVVIHRLPKMMEQEWAQDCRELLGQEAVDTAPYTLWAPRSACPHCGHQIRWYENIPVVSYLALRGRCSGCKAPISARYPVIEAVTALLFAWCGHQFGATWAALAWCAFSALLVSMTCIDWDTQLLPDDLTYSLLWLGLLGSVVGWTGVPVAMAVLGALAGYLSLWTVTQAFKLLTGKIGMGNGDFKLFAALGAWFGWQALVPIILLSCVVGIVVGVALKAMRKSGQGDPIPFGPFLSGAGFLAMFLGGPALLQGMGHLVLGA
ncbi:prepilin peptidase [Comamonas serinivorans]|uniref:prepilin peptidase n=1 Tax=Comamonas serinivorans TaxID=1082851 RepID=UPI001F41A47C|nr:A24 family peptidase [Comamonas serinivorans]